MSRLEQIRQERLKKVEILKQKGINPYSNFCCQQLTIKNAQAQTGKSVAIVGRIIAKRGHGKLVFIDLKDASGQIQLMLKADQLPNFELIELLDIGDFISIQGQVTSSQAGELSILASSVELLTKAIRPLPEKWHGLKDVEGRYRQRYVDLLVNPQVREIFLIRTKVVSLLRRFLDDQGFIEVETPVLQPIYGGATAKPFTTHHQALDTDLYLRISDELYLKRLIVGGWEKVYEMSKDFRNEGFSREHNPEFTMLEFYWAYTDYEKLMEFTEQMLVALLESLGKTMKLTYQGQIYDFTPPWPRITYRDLLFNHLQIDIDQVTNESELNAIVKAKQLLDENLVGYGEILDHLYKHHIRPQLTGPLFLIDHPAEMIPLAKRKHDNPNKVATFQLLVAGHELIKAYNELNDPLDQRQRWGEEMTRAAQGATEYQILDEDYLRALEYGMPPTAGWGMGIDRLVSFLTDQPNLKEVILFPTLRPEK